jgi:altronate dehydratase small subunit
LPTRKAIVINSKDNVANALTDIHMGETVVVIINNNPIEIISLDDISLGHKFAIREILKGEAVIKYGETIGRATGDIKIGNHVHIHNVESLRARGDLSNRLSKQTSS